MKKKSSNVFKSAIMGAMAIATSLTFGLTACSNGGGDTDDDDSSTTVTRVDDQKIKNGNFEYYSNNKGLYPIASPNNWNFGNSGSSSTSMSGIIDTNKARWDYITDPTLPATLEANDDLKSDDGNKKDYNGALTDDMLYINTHKAIESNASEEDKKYIPNPLTHGYKYNDAGEILDDNGNVRTTYADDEGRIYFDEDKKEPANTSVLMIHNYRRSYFTGNEGHYTSTSAVTLEASTACEISVWVKTTELYFDGAKAERTEVKSERGAYIQVASTVGGNSIDDFIIKNIDTEAINTTGENNGWVKYTVYVQASSFADTTVTLTLGLGESDVYTVEGYAFFDDVTFTQYDNIAALEEACPEFNEDNLRNEDTEDRTANVSHPLTPDGQTVFRTDKVSYKTNNPDGTLAESPDGSENNFADRHFFINFATDEEDAISFDSNTVKAGLTVEKTTTGNYVSAKYDETDNKFGTAFDKPDNGADTAYLPTSMRPSGLNVKDDLITAPKIGADWTFGYTTAGGGAYPYTKTLTEALKSAATLPGAPEDGTDTLIIMSARGASYEAVISDGRFTLEDGEYAIVSFWLKNSDMGGSTACTVTAYEVGKESNNATFNLDTTTQTALTVNGKENAYDGWVKCFVRVGNVTKDKDNAKEFAIKVNFGTTSIKGTTKSSYKAGWLAVTNASVMKVDKDVFDYSGSVSHSASLTFNATEEKTVNNFDTELGGSNVIKTDLAIPASYTGVNGASSNITSVKNDVAYDATNGNKAGYGTFTGLLNSAYVDKYAENDYWYPALRSAAGLDPATSPADVWKEIFGDSSSQPLVIMNTNRDFGDGARIYNYGYIGTTQTVSAEGYAAVSVKVKVTAGGIANIYLVEDKTVGGSNVLSYELPQYNFWYDDDGNILKGEPDPDALSNAEKKKNVAYFIRKDGLYEKDGDGKLYANLYNLTKYYDSVYEHEDFFDENGERVHFKNLVQGETYYADKEKTAYAPHHLITSGASSSKVYEYVSGTGNDACYYYMENGKANGKKVVYTVSTEDAKLRYDNPSENAEKYRFTIDTTTTEGAKYANKWVTVTFYVHAGSEAKSYKLELWSGERDGKTNEKVTEGSFVMFDYNSISVDQSTYDGLVEEYTNAIAADLKEKLAEKDVTLDSNDLSIAELEKIAKANGVDLTTLYDYKASFYAFSLFDLPSFIPFNGETAYESASGYSFKYSESEESLTFLKVADDGAPTSVDADDGVFSMSAFIDYAVIDKNIEIISSNNSSNSSSNDSSSSSSNKDSKTNVWLLAASIALIAAMFIAFASILLRQLIKKIRRSKTAGKNTYNFNRNKRYVKQYVKANGEAPEVKPVEEGEVDESLLTDKVEKPAEESAPATEATGESAEATGESTENGGDTTPAESSEDNTDGNNSTPAEDGAEASEKPADETKAEDEPAENTDGEKPDDNADGDTDGDNN